MTRVTADTPQTQSMSGTETCHCQLLTLEGSLLLRHNLAHPDGYVFQGHTEVEDFIHLVFQQLFD